MKKFFITLLLAVVGVIQLSAQDNEDLLFGQENNTEQEAEIAEVVARTPHKKGVKVDVGYLVSNNFLVKSESRDYFTVHGGGLVYASLAGTEESGFDFSADLKIGLGKLKSVKEEGFDVSYLHPTCKEITLLGSVGYCFATSNERLQLKFYPLGIGLGYNDFLPEGKHWRAVAGMKFKGLFFLTPSIGICAGLDGTICPNSKKYQYQYYNVSLAAGIVIAL